MALLANVTKTANAGGGNWTSMILMIVIMVVFVVIMIVPQKKREKKIKEMLANIKPGNKVRTIGGIYGKVVAVNDDRVIVESAEGTQIEFAKGAISTVESADVEAEMGDIKK